MKHEIKLIGAFVALSLTTACAGDDSTDDTAAGSSGTSAADTMSPTTADDGDDDGGSTSNGETGTPGSSGGDTAADSTGGDTAADSTDGGDTMGDDESSGSGTTGAMGGATVTGTVFRDAATNPGLGLDAIGDIYLGLLISCNQDAASVASTVVMDGDLSNPDNGEAYTIENVPDGTYFLAGFMDDNGNANPDDPDADMGDLAAAEGFGPACTQVDVVGGAAVMGADLTFNLVVPF